MSIEDEEMGSICRRTFLDKFSRLVILVSTWGLAETRLLPVVTAEDGITSRNLFAYGDESRMPTSNCFTIGFLYAERPDEHRLRIKALRKKHNYRKVFEYNCTDKYKIPFAMDVMDYFFAESDLRFISTVAGESKTRERFHYKNVVDKLAPQESKIFLTLKMNSRVGGGKDIRDYLKKEVGRVGEIKVIRRKEDDLIQMADFFTGNVALAAAARTNECIASKNKNKTKLLETLQEHLKVSSLIDASLQRRKKFRVLHA